MHSETHALQATFRALADPTRRAIIAQLEQDDLTIAEVAAGFDMTRAAIKKHLNVLAEGDIVVVERRGREAVNRLQPMALKRAADWLNHFDRFWDDRLAALQDAIAKETTDKKDNLE